MPPAQFFADPQAEADFVQQSSARFRQIATYQANQQTAMRAARIVQHYRKYPWTNPGLAVAFAKWKEAYGPQVAKGLAHTAFDATQSGDDPRDALEEFAMTREFKRQARAFQESKRGDSGGGFLSELADVVVKPVTAPYRIAKGIVEGDASGALGAAFDITPLGTIKETTEAGAAGISELPRPTFGPFSDRSDDPGLRLPGVPSGRAVTRAAFTALETPYQEIQGQAVSALTGLIGPVGDQAQPAKPGSRADLLGAASGTPDFQPLSSGGIALERVAQGKPVDLGTGFLPGGQIEEERDRRLRDIASLSYGGQQHFLTPGRLFAYGADNLFHIAEPGSIPFQVLSGAVDAASILTLDPTNIGLTKLGEGLQARKALDLTRDVEAAGGFKNAWRTFTHGPTVQQFWDSQSRGGRVLASMAQSDPAKDFLWWQRATNWKIPSGTLAEALRQDTPEAVRAIIEPLSGTVLEAQPNPWSVGSIIRQTTQPYRLANLRPFRAIDTKMLDGPGGALNTVYQHMKNLRVPDEQVSESLYALATAKSSFGLNEGLKWSFRIGRDTLVANGVPRDLAENATRIWHNDLAEGALYHVNQIADTTGASGVMIDGKMLPFDTPHLWAQAMDSKVWLPDPREVDKLYARYGKIFGIPGTGFGTVPNKMKYGAWIGKTALTNIQSKFWVPLQLLRGAWTVRVVGDEMARMSMAGYDSINHPVRMLGWIASRKNPTEADLLASIQGQAALSHDIGIFMGDPNASVVDMLKDNRGKNLVAAGRDVFHPGDSRHAEAWANQLIQLHTDPIAKQVATVIRDGGSLEDLKQSFYDGALSGFRKDLMDQPKLAKILTPPSGSDAYIDHLANTIHDMTGGHADLVSFLASGKYGDEAAQAAGQVTLAGRHAIDEGLDPTLEGLIVQHKAGDTIARIYYPGADEPITVAVADLTLTDTKPVIAQTMATDGVKIDRGFVGYLNALPDGVKPANVIGERALTEQQQSMYDKVVRTGFAALMSVPSNVLDRQSTFRQAYWNRIEEMMPLMDRKSQELFIANANAGEGIRRIPKVTREALADAAKGASGELSYSEIDELAKGHALDQVNDLLYQLNRRGQFFDATRLLFPFGEAWKEILTTWTKIIANNPQTLRKFQIGIDELRSSNPFDMIPGAVPEAYKNQGFFFKDPATGQESFGYPWSAAVNDTILGVPIQFNAPVSGLSLAFNVMPGVGPIVQFGANALMDRFLSDPKYDPIRDVLFPYGEPDFAHGVVESFAPPWMQKFLTSMSVSKEDTRALNNTAAQVYAYKVSTGEYDPHASTEEIGRDFADALKTAGAVYRVRGSFQFGAPAAPNPQFLIDSKKGLVQFSTLRDELYKLQQKDADTAVGKFLNRFGEKAFYATQSFTLSGSYALPFTTDQVDWARRNPDTVDTYPTTYGFFAPAGDPKDFDYDAYARSIQRGERTPISGVDWVKHANNTLGWMWYDKARQALGLEPGKTGTRKQQLFLTDLRDKIREFYPGWNDVESTPNKLAHAVDELHAASQDRGLAKAHPELTTALDLYFQGRDKAITAVEHLGGSSEFGRPGYQSGQRYAHIREFLRNIAAAIVEEYPQFENVWQTVLSREVGDE